MSKYDGHDDYLQSYRNKQSNKGPRDVIDWILALSVIPTLTRLIFVTYDPDDGYMRLFTGLCALGIAAITAFVLGYIMSRDKTQPGTRLTIEMSIGFACMVFFVLPIVSH